VRIDGQPARRDSSDIPATKYYTRLELGTVFRLCELFKDFFCMETNLVGSYDN
jgi:hypothetical protein